MALTPEDLEMLTEEERAGYEEDLDDEDTDPEADESESEDDGEPDTEGEDDGESDDSDNESDDSDSEADDSVTEADDTDTAEDDTEEPEGEPMPVPQAIEGADEKRAEFEASRDELTEKYENGDITTTEYMKDLRKIDKDEDELNWRIREAELEARRVSETVNAKWYGHVESFLSERPEIQRSKLTMDAYDQLVREETAKTIDKGYQPGPADLQRAYKRWCADLGYEEAAAPAPKPAKAKAKADKGKRPVPPSLAKVPASDMTDTDDGEFAHLDRMADSDPLGFEEQLAKMPDALRDRYMASS